jgi:ribosomal protein S18 acetylase RimI-like enzyme
MDEDAERIRRFERSLEDRLATRVEPFAWGRAFLDDRFPKRYDSNFLAVERPLANVRARDLAVEADRVLGRAGLAHREVVVDDDEDGRRIAPGLIRLGYEADHLVTMAQRREPDRWGVDFAEEVGFATIRPALEEVNRRRSWGADEEAVRMLADYRAVMAERIGARFFVVRVEGRIASTCEVYPGEGIAQIEDVNTFEEFRGKGFARAVVLAAVREMRAARCDLVFLNALADDWPRHLYERLGFDVVRQHWSFLRTPSPAI